MSDPKIRRLAAIVVVFFFSAPASLEASTPEIAALIDAVKRGDEKTVQSMVTLHPHLLEGPDASGNRPLHWAARHGRLEIAQWLIHQGAQVDAKNMAGATPLIHGVRDVRLTRLLLQNKADVNATSNRGMTPLLAAAATPGALSSVRLLIRHGADVKARGPRGATAMALAAANNDLKLVQFLSEQGAEINPQGTSTPLWEASWHGHREIVEWLLEQGADPNLGSFHAGHSLNMALYGQHPEVAAILVQHGATLDHRSPNGQHRTPTMVWSAYHEGGDLVVARQMLERGADVNAAAATGATALDWARSRGNRALEQWLFEAGATESSLLTKEKVIPNREPPRDEPQRNESIRLAIERASRLLQHSSDRFLANTSVKKAGCVSCHHQTLPAVAIGWARERGFPMDEISLARQLEVQRQDWNQGVETAYEMVSPQPNVAVLLGYGLEALATLNYPSDAMTESMVHYLLSKQQLDGHWSSNDNRPPMEDGAIQATAFALRSVQRYPVPGRELECENRVQRASLWLRQAVPVTFNQRAFQLLGLGWAGAPPSVVQPLVEDLLKRQNEDGGWSQLSGLPSDSWGTGQALVAMHQAGRIDTSHPAFATGVDFLLRTQFDDGSWFVKSRTWPFQPHFDSGFPHGKDQWISAGGTAWACMALLLTQPTVDALPTWDWTGLAERVAIAEREGLTERAEMGKRPESSASSAEGTSVEKVDFERQIKPVLERSCVACHSGEAPQGGLQLSTREGLLTHGESGEPAVVPFDRKQGLLLRYAADEVEDLEMPPLAERGRFTELSRDELDLLRFWIDQGCEWPDACRLEAPRIDKEP